jgi:prolyl-tRNA synthetase
MPTGGIDSISRGQGEPDDAQALLYKAGFLRQGHSGVFHLLPLGLRVQEKLEGLIDKHMKPLGASKVALSSISSESLWQRSGRLDNASELLRIKDRRDSKFILSPTHEEEITQLVASIAHTYKDLPLRLYQISRKYRDELRPRKGLLRAKEFLMKDLYTFDLSEEEALYTYRTVCQAYAAFLDELKIPYVIASADSGNMGGNLSHEYHFISPIGEDTLFTCNHCSYVANEELVEARIDLNQKGAHTVGIWNNSQFYTKSFYNVNKDKLYTIYLPPHQWADTDLQGNWFSSGTATEEMINVHAVKRAFPDIDFGSNPADDEEPEDEPSEVYITDYRVHIDDSEAVVVRDEKLHDFLRVRDGDGCPKCSSGVLKSHKAIEIGHTFHLGTRYSRPLQAYIAPPKQDNTRTEEVPLQMGCHGIGVSRLIGATASLLADSTGLNWPRAIAPYEVVLIPGRGVSEGESTAVYDELSSTSPGNGRGLDVLLDDRESENKGLVWKMKDADLIGYPVIILLGRDWKNGKVEVQCRRLGNLKEQVEVANVRDFVTSLLEKL